MAPSSGVKRGKENSSASDAKPKKAKTADAGPKLKPDTAAKGKRKADEAAADAPAVTAAPAPAEAVAAPDAAALKKGTAQIKKSKATSDAKKEAAAPIDDDGDNVMEDGEAAEEAKRAAVGSGRQAAQGKGYKEKSALGRSGKDDYIVVSEEPECDTEAEAFEQTIGKGIKRR